MRIILNRIWISHEPLVARDKGSVSGQVEFEKGLKIDFDEELLPEELEYIRDGLGDLTERVRARVLNALRGLDERKVSRKKGQVPK